MSSKTSVKKLSSHCSTQCMRAHGGDVKLMTHRQEDTCRLLQKWHVKCAGQDVDAGDGEGLPLRQTPCGEWKNTLVDVTPCYSIHLLSLPAPSLCTPLKHLWPRRGERDIRSGVCWGTLFMPSPSAPSLRMKLFFAVHQRGSLLFIQAFFLLSLLTAYGALKFFPRSVAVTSYGFS